MRFQSKKAPNTGKERTLIHPSIVKSGKGVISIFNSGNQGQQEEYVAGCILYLSDSIILISSKIKAFIDTISNICDEIKALIFLLTVVVEEKVIKF